MDNELPPPPHGGEPESSPAQPALPGEAPEGAVGEPAPLMLPAASLPTGEIPPGETTAAPDWPALSDADVDMAGAAAPAAAAAAPVDAVRVYDAAEVAAPESVGPDNSADETLPAAAVAAAAAEGAGASTPPAAETAPAPARPRVTFSERVVRWLPAFGQLTAAARGRVADAIGPDPEGAAFTPGLHTSMRQAMGLVILVGLIAGLSRFVWLWWELARADTVLPLLQLERATAALAARFPAQDALLLFNQQVAGLAPRAPGWVAGGLNALGAWLSTPLRLLTFWLVDGLLVLAAAKLLGAGTTLPRFYAAFGYAALPLLLLIFWPLPLLGPLLAAIGVLLALVWAFLAVRAVTGLDGGRTLLSLLLPLVVALAVWGLLTGLATAWAFV